MTIDSSPTYSSYSSPNELKEVYSELVGNVRLQFILSSIRIHLGGFIPDVSMKLYSHESQGAKCWICFKFFANDGNQVFVGSSGTPILDEFQKFFMTVLKSCDELENVLNFGIQVFGQKDLTEISLQEVGLQRTSSYPSYYLSPKKSHKSPVHNLPEGYSIDRIGEIDVELVTKMWLYGKKNEEFFVRKRIATLPSVCIRYPEGTVDGKSTVARWALCEHSGMIIHLFVMKEHRRNGLQKVIMSELAHQMKKRIGITAFYGALIKNDSMVRCIEQHEFVLNENDEPFLVSYVFWSLPGYSQFQYDSVESKS